jgi:hypothetical protein
MLSICVWSHALVVSHTYKDDSFVLETVPSEEHKCNSIHCLTENAWNEMKVQKGQRKGIKDEDTKQIAIR